MIRFNYAIIDGEVVTFENSDDGFAEGWDTQEFLSLVVNGTVFRDYALEGELKYNQDDDPDESFRLKLSRDENYLIFGDQPDMFSDPYFTRYTSPFRGLTLHLETERFGMTTFGAISKGSTEKEEIIPDGTSGSYFLGKIPVVPGSETVTLEVRNRNDQNQVIEIIPRERNVDYTIDYDIGEIIFAEPVDSETFRGDPVFIIVTYRSEEESSAFGTALTGARATVKPTEWAQIGATYVSEFDRDASLSDGFDARLEVYGIDGTFTFGDSLKLSTEYALSHDLQNPVLNDVEGTEDGNEVRQAFQATLDTRLGKNIDISGKYHLTEREFLTFANPDIDPDEQELELVGKYAFLPNHSLGIGYSFLQDNLPRDSETPTTTTHRPYISWDATLREHTELFSKYEYIQTTDDQTPGETDKQTHIFLAGGIQEFQSIPIFKKLILRGEYQLSDFEDKTDQEADTITHQLGVRARTEPLKDLAAYAEQKERLIHDKDLKKNTERQDISELGIELDRWERFSVTSKYQYRSTHDLLRKKRTSERHVLIFKPQYQPFEVLKATGKLELRDETFFEVDEGELEEEAVPDIEEVFQSDESSSQTLNLEGRLTYNPKKDLALRLRYEYEHTKDQAETKTTTREDETEFRVNYAFDRRKTRLTGAIKVERDLLEAPPTPETKTRTITYLASGARQLTDRWDILAQYKREEVDIEAGSVRDDILGEIGCKAGRFLKLAAGYQYSEFQDNNDSSEDYTAHSFFVKLIGKL